MISAFASRSSSLDLSPAWIHCVVFSGGRHFTLRVPLSTRVKLGSGEINAWDNPGMN